MRSLRAYLALLTLGAMLPGIILTAVLVQRAFVTTRATSERRLLDSARVDAAALDRAFASVISVLQVLATSPALDRGDLQTFHAEGRRVQQTQPGWYSIVLLSSDAQQLVNTRLDWGRPLTSAAEPDSLRSALRSGQPTVGVIRAAPSGGPELLFAVRVPVLRDGQLRYVVSATLNVDALQNVVPRLTPDTDEWTRTLLDPEGTVAVRTRDAHSYVGTVATDEFRQRIQRAAESVTRGVSREGTDVYAATSRGQFGWTAVVVVPRASLDEPLTAVLTTILPGGILLLVCGLLAAFFVSRRLTADLDSFAIATAALADGRPVERRRGYVTETQGVQASLASAASLLRQRERERDEHIRVAEEANRTKDHFLALLGHELRNPLAPAVTALEVMRLRDPNAFARERAVLERQIAHMARLVDDLLDMSRLASGKIQIQRSRFELRDAVDRAVDMVQSHVNQKNQRLEVTVAADGLPLDGDRDRIVQVVANLLMNATKYTPSQGHLRLTATVVDDDVHIACEDDGPGIPVDLLPNLFEPFAQGHRTIDRREGGMGLGLALARSLTERHGGRLTYEPVDSGGSRFIVVLPLAAGGIGAQETSLAGHGQAQRFD